MHLGTYVIGYDSMTLQISVGSVEKMLAYSREAAPLISDLYAHLNVLVLITESTSALYGQLLL